MTDNTSETTNTETQCASTTYVGRVKWFNNRAGYGFITVTSGEYEGQDFFTHHSAVTVGEEQYRYLVQGEYVDVTLMKSESEKYEFQSERVTGVNGGKLMCETREEQRRERKANGGGDSTQENGDEEGGWSLSGGRGGRGSGGRGGRGRGRGRSSRGGRGGRGEKSEE